MCVCVLDDRPLASFLCGFFFPNSEQQKKQRMFGIKRLSSASKFSQLTKDGIQNTGSLVTQLVNSKPVSRQSIVYLDRISRELSEVLDPLSAVSRLHCDSDIREQAAAAVHEMQTEMEKLNADRRIFDCVRELREKQDELDLTIEEREIVRVSETQWAQSHTIDDSQTNETTEKNPAWSHFSSKEKFMLSEELITAEADFIDGCHNILRSDMVVPSVAAAKAKSDAQTKEAEVILPVDSRLYSIGMRNWTSEVKRRELFMKYFDGSEARFAHLNRMRVLRHQTALDGGYQTFADWKAVNSLLGDRRKIEDYLLSLQKDFYERAKEEVSELREIKGYFCDDLCDSSINGSGVLQAWDLSLLKRLMYLRREAKQPSMAKLNQRLSDQLTLDQSLQCLIRIVDMCFNLQMERVPFALPGSEYENESWLVISEKKKNGEEEENGEQQGWDNSLTSKDDDDPFGEGTQSKILDASQNGLIWKCEIRDPLTRELIGVLYLDLFERKGKQRTESIVYPVQCAYYYTDDDNDHDQKPRIKRMVPSVVLCLNLPVFDSDGKPGADPTMDDARLSMSLPEFGQSLLHEFGHALQYLLCTSNEYQTLSGCRGLCFEYLEYSSTLMERFAYDSDFVKHVIFDGVSSSLNGIINSNNNNNNKNENDELQQLLNQLRIAPFWAVHHLQQVCHSLMDLRLFGQPKHDIKQEFIDSFAPALELYGMDYYKDDPEKQDEFVNGHLLSVSRHLHFVDYPSQYYAYAMADEMARVTWDHSFGDKSELDHPCTLAQYRQHLRKNGRMWFDHVLSQGCSKPALTCLSNMSALPESFANQATILK